MNLRDFARSLRPGNDAQLAKQYTSESASDRATRLRREKHHARINRNGDNAGKQMPRRYRRHNG